MKTIIPLTFIVAITSNVFSQGIFLNRDTSGFEFGADLFGSDNSTYGADAHFGISYFSLFDLGLSGGSGRMNRTVNNTKSNFQYYLFSPSLAIHLLKQDAHMPFSISIVSSYETDSYRSDLLTQENLELFGSKYAIGGSLSRYFQTTPRIRMQPSIGIDYSKEQVRYGDYTLTSSYYSHIYYSLGCDFIFKTQNNNLFRIGGTIRANEDDATYTIHLSEILPSVHHHYHPQYIFVPDYPVYRVVPAEKSKIIEPTEITVNIPNSKGGFIQVRLIKNSNGYIGPEGEFYPDRPTIAQLEVLYGD